MSNIFHNKNKMFSSIGNGKYQKRILLLFAGSLMANVMEYINMGHILPAAKCDLNITNAQQGFIISTSYIGSLLTIYFWGLLADTWGRKKVLHLAYSLCCIFSIISSLSYSSTMLIICRVFVGLRYNQLIHLSFFFLF